MKTKMNFLLVLMSAIVLHGCGTDGIEKTSTAKTTAAAAEFDGKYYIYYAHWSEWGRTSRSCSGWGLCEYEDCWSCDVDDKHTGKIVVDETKEGHLYISLDPRDILQYEAIQLKEPFYVDEEINNTNSVLHKGQYEFDASIGTHGGYKLRITLK